MEPIISTKNERVKLVYGLQNRVRTRRKARKIALEGVRLIGDALERRHKPLFVFYDEDAASTPGGPVADLMTRLGDQYPTLELVPVSPEVMAYVSATETPPGIIAVLPMPFPPMPKDPRRILILDNVRDPGNLGGILRTAAAAGVEGVILAPGCADPYNPKALRSGMGAHFRVPVIEAESWQDIVLFVDALTVYLAAGDADLEHDAVDWTQPWALVIGSEAHGLGESLAHFPDGVPVRIPMAADTESLNAGVAAGVLLFEAARQHRRARS